MEQPISVQAVSCVESPTEQDSVFAVWQERCVSRQTFYSHVRQLSTRLPQGRFAFNLCADKYLFCVSFIAVLLRKQINLLPPNRSDTVLDELSTLYPESYYITDQSNTISAKQGFLVEGNFAEGLELNLPFVPLDQTAAINFTSGSTGQPKAAEKNWQAFHECARLAVRQLQLSNENRLAISTVPPQHMYGLETGVFWPLYSNMSIYSGMTFYPEDIRLAADAVSTPCVLISTPPHLKACVEANIKWRNISTVLSSTAPMSPHLAQQIETHFDAPLYEIFGSTETLSFASRRPTQTDCWRPYPSIKIVTTNDTQALQTDYFDKSILLDDLLEISEAGTFRVVGRRTDLVKVAGKRTSLNEINQRLNQIDGVNDGVFFIPQGDSETRRLGALVVSKLTKQYIMEQLKRSIDPVFVPRPLFFVNHIPRNSMGKIKQAELQQLILDLANENQRL